MGHDRFLLAYVLARRDDFDRAGGETAAALTQFDRLLEAWRAEAGRRPSATSRAIKRLLDRLLLAARDLYPSLPAHTL